MEEHNALGLFSFSTDGRCEIQIGKNIMGQTSYFMIVLVHEYLHFVHFRMVSPQEYRDCPRILSEGFLGCGCRVFYENAHYDIPPELRKSWNASYEVGRMIVSQICNEGFGIGGFARGFLTNIKANCPWRRLDHLFN